MGELTVSVIIRALNEAHHLPALFAGLGSQSRRVDEIVLVDSGSTDASVAIAESYGAKVVRIAPHEFSFGRALNVGCEAAVGDVLVFVSAHVYPADDAWLAQLITPFEAHPDVVLVYGHQRGGDRNHFSERQLMRRWFPPTSDRNQRHPFCNNANCAVRRIAWERAPYNEDLTGLEDMDWANRALERGERLWYEASASIVHVHEEAFGQTASRYRREAIAHRRIFNGQRMGALEAMSLCVLNVARDYLAAARSKELGSNLRSIARFRIAQFWGSWQGFRDSPGVPAELKRRFYYPKGFDFTARGARERLPTRSRAAATNHAARATPPPIQD